MRRILFTIAASVALVIFVPASALAAKRHERHHHHHHHHHKRAHVKTFGKFTTKGSSTTTPSSPSGVGTVSSFDGTTLVITLNDGTTTETGVVNNDTEMECEASNTTVHSDDGGPGGGDNSGDNGDRGDQGDNNGDQGDDNGDQQQNPSCSTADLKQGATVLAAELRISSDGAVWKKIELMP
jgi:hypothetical protein